MNGTERTMEKRKTPRREADYVVLLRVSDLLQGRGQIRNISRDGILLKTFNLFRHIRNDRIPERIGSPIKIVFSSSPLTMHGRIVRINPQKGEVAINLRNINNQDAWEKMCED